MDIKEFQVSEKDGYSNHPWEYARSKVVFNIIKKYIPQQNTHNETVLDVGCGDVFFLTQFAKLFSGYQLKAVDSAFDNELVTYLSDKYQDYKIEFYKDIKELQIINDKVSLVFLLDVIEHIEDDIDFLRSLSTHINSNKETLFVITVPAYNGLYCAHDKWLGHYRRYSQKELKQHVIEAGLTPVSGGYFFTSLLFPRMAQKLLESMRKSKDKQIQGVGNWTGGKVISFIYEKILLLDYYFFKLFRVFNIRIPGLSTYILCKKS
jgi:2-polyprenyl-3-methyl-5-hydroxy-6-metoxy-1,4-benzoquinol methylase